MQKLMHAIIMQEYKLIVLVSFIISQNIYFSDQQIQGRNNGRKKAKQIKNIIVIYIHYLHVHVFKNVRKKR